MPNFVSFILSAHDFLLRRHKKSSLMDSLLQTQQPEGEPSKEKKKCRDIKKYIETLLEIDIGQKHKTAKSPAESCAPLCSVTKTRQQDLPEFRQVRKGTSELTFPKAMPFHPSQPCGTMQGRAVCQAAPWGSYLRINDTQSQPASWR